MEKQVKEYLQWLIQETFTLDGIPNKVFEKVHSLFGVGNENIKYILHALDTLCKKDPAKDSSCKLNEIYHSKKLYKYIYHYKTKIKLTKLLSGAAGPKTLEKGAVLVSKWNNPEKKLSEKVICQELDEIASAVRCKCKLLEYDPFFSSYSGRKSHCKNICHVSIEELQKVPQDFLSNIEEINFEKARQVISIINQVLYKELKFGGNTRQYYNVENSFIDKVLEKKTGIPITLSIIYMAVGRRLGLTIQGVNFPNHFLIRLTVKEPRADQYLYIDCFNKGEVLTVDDCLEKFMKQYQQNNLPRNVLFEVADERKTLIRMVANITNIHRQNSVLSTRNMYLLQTCLELMIFLAPKDDENRLLLSKIYLHQGINLEEVVDNLQNLQSNHYRPSAVLDSLLTQAHECKNEKRGLEIKCRSKYTEVEYRIGMIMKHKRFSAKMDDTVETQLRYNYMCVIYGWDPICRMSEDWKQQMGIYNLPKKDTQPYYNVLAHDSSSRYAAQENLAPAHIDHHINHPEVGKYFESFNGREYVASEMLNECFPEDQPIRSNTQ